MMRNEQPPIWHVAPSPDSKVRELCAKLRAKPGLWEWACETALWSLPLPDGTPVMDENGALAGILDHAGEHDAPNAKTLREAVIATVGAEDVAGVLPVLGRRRMHREPWCRWKLWGGEAIEEEDLQERWFAEGWMDGPEDGEEDEEKLLVIWHESMGCEVEVPF